MEEIDYWSNRYKKRDYICKSEINRRTLKQMNIPSAISVEQVVKDFNDIVSYGNFIILKTGNMLNPSQQRHTYYVNKHELYLYVIKGRLH